MRSVIDASEEWMTRNLLLLGSVTVIYPSRRDRDQGTRPTISQGDRDRAVRAA